MIPDDRRPHHTRVADGRGVRRRTESLDAHRRPLDQQLPAAGLPPGADTADPARRRGSVRARPPQRRPAAPQAAATQETPVDLDVLLFGSHANDPAPLTRPGSGNGRVSPECSTDLIRAVLGIVEEYIGELDVMRDVRHRDAKAWPFLDAWLDDLDLEGKRPRTIYAYERSAAPLLRTNPDTGFDEFTPEQIKKALALVPQRSRYISRSVYAGWFEWGELNDHIGVNPMRKIRKIPAGERRPTGLFTEAEVGLLTGLPSPDGPLWALLFGALLRRGDAIGLRRGDVDLDRLRVYIYDGKGGKDAVIPITRATAAAVADLDLFERLDPADHLWYRRKYNPSRKTPISSTEFDRWYRRCIEAAGVRYLKPHTTRHTGHWILKHVEGLDLEERQIVLRHASPETTVKQYPVTDVEDVARKRAGAL